jgi:two-component system response regulator CpxR
VRQAFQTVTQPIEVGVIRIEPSARRVTVNAVAVDCTTIEYSILEYLARRAGTVVSRDELMEAVSGRHAAPLDRSLDVHISHLRRKLRHVGRRIVTVRGVGHMLAVLESDSQ